jgi:hypothetical protein
VDTDGRPSPRIHVPPADLELAAVTTPAAEVDEASTDLEGDATAAPAEDGAPKRKRSRRGSRGGRKRRKTPAEGNVESEATDIVGDAAQDGPEYVPMSEWIEDFDAAKRA